MKMHADGATLGGMAKRKALKERSTNDPHRKPRVVFHPPADLLERFDKQVDLVRPGTDRTKVLVMLIEEWLRGQESRTQSS